MSDQFDAMRATFLDLQDNSNPYNGYAVENPKQLFDILATMSERAPFCCELAAQNGFTLNFGLGGAFSHAQFSRSDGQPPYLLAKPSVPVSLTEEVEFLCGDTPTPIPNEFILPVEILIPILQHFQNFGSRWPLIEWVAL